MSRLDTAIPAPVLGAGRSFSYAWPTTDYNTSGSLAPLSTFYRPVGFNIAGQLVRGTGGAPPSPQGATEYKGRTSYRVTSDDTSVTVYQCISTSAAPYSLYFAINTPVTAGPPGLYQFGCWRIAALLAFENPAGALTGDFGLTLCPGLNTAVVAGTESGISMGPSNANTLTLTVRKTDGGAVTYSQPCPFAVDITQWHLYEMVIRSASLGVNASLTILIDGVQAWRLEWGAGTVLPGLISGTNLGYRWSLSNRAGQVGGIGVYVAVPGIEVSAAPTPLALY